VCNPLAVTLDAHEAVPEISDGYLFHCEQITVNAETAEGAEKNPPMISRRALRSNVALVQPGREV
jgi:hypothetical protein